MTETSTVNPTQEAANRLGTQHPAKQILAILDRIERLEGILLESAKNAIASQSPSSNSTLDKRRAALVKARAARAAKKI